MTLSFVLKGMVMKFLVLSAFFLSVQSHAQFNHLSSLERYLLEIQYKEELLHGSKKKKKAFDPKVECVQKLQTAKTYWEKDKREGKNLIIEGEMSKSFSRTDIESMGNVHMHGLKTKVRGTDKYLPGGYSYGSAPSFPHSYPGCEDFFQEEVKVIDVGSKKCRQVKFSYPEIKDAFYFQTYCQDSTKLGINFHPENLFAPEEIIPKTTDCTHCP